MSKRKIPVKVRRHWVNPEWGTTFCGKALKPDLNYTTTQTAATCPDCFSSHKLLEELSHAKPDDFGESK